MDAWTETISADRALPPAAAVVRTALGHAVVAALLVLMPSVATLLVLRRLAGAMTQPLPVLGFWTAALALAACAVAVRFGAGSSRAGHPWFTVAVWAVPAVSLVVCIAALWIPGTGAAVGMSVIALAVLEEAASGSILWRRAASRDSSGRLAGERIARAPESSAAPRSEAAAETVTDASTEIDAASPLDTRITQQLTRRTAGDGSEEINGVLRATFLPDEKTVVLHVAFCPPLKAIPEVTARQTDGPAARVKVAQVVPHGTRLEVRRTGKATGPANVVLQFAAKSPPEDSPDFRGEIPQ
jgi:hypothetical protein